MLDFLFKIIITNLVLLLFLYFLRHKFFPKVSNKIFILVLIYFMLIFSFAHIYQNLYNGENERFVFQNDILKKRVSEVTRREMEKKENLTTQLNAVNKLYDSLSHVNYYMKLKPGSFGWEVATFNIDGYTYEFDHSSNWTVIGSNRYWKMDQFFIFNDNGNLVFQDTFRVEGPLITLSNTKQFEKEIDSIFSPSTEMYSKILLEIRNRFKSAQSARQSLWKFIDFVYFSTVTQTTLGYGDILPNSAVVRMFVIIQVISGILIIVFGIYFFVTGEANLLPPKER